MEEQKENKKLQERAIQIKKEIFEEAKKLSDKYDGAPVVIIVAGSKEARVLQCLTGWAFPDKETRLRDIVGVLQTAIQIESLRHFGIT
ncbi:MAG: hypothetical protein ACFFDI_07690 [Promethearchaeota archaeon]